MDDNLDRAMKAYFRSGDMLPQPSASSSTMERFRDKAYAVLRNSYAMLAVYRVLNSGKLKRLIRYPEELETY